MNNITVCPGENSKLSVPTVGYGLGTVPGSVIAKTYDGDNNFLGDDLQYLQEVLKAECQDVGYSIVSERDHEEINLMANT